MDAHISAFAKEYGQEIGIARTQLLALADAASETVYCWRPAEGARSFGAVLVHIAASNLGLLHVAGIRTPDGADLYGELADAEPAPLVAMIRRNISLEQTLTARAGVIDFLRRSFEAVQHSFGACGADDLEKAVQFLGERTTLRRVYLRMIAHTHEHMGQAIAYARTYGMTLPWPDPLQGLDPAQA